MPIAVVPEPGTEVPPAIASFARGPVTLVWKNMVGGITARIEGDPQLFVKWNPAGSGESLAREAERMKWLRGRHPVPRVVEYRALADGGELLATEGVRDADGELALPAVDPVWVARPDDAIAAFAEGLRRLHALPVEECPFDWSVEARAAGREMPVGLRDLPPVDRLVVCHGDACAPNTLVGSDGRFAATVDLSRLGVADRWADLAIAFRSLGWNYPEFDESVFWEAYGIEPDAERIAYYTAFEDAL